MAYSEKTDKGLFTCPNNHLYNANTYGDICPNCGAKQQDKKKTPEEYEKELKLEPNEWVCGFLVCIEGVNKGRVYTLHEGKNFIGSDPNMDVYIKGDLEIEPENHAVIMYDSRERQAQILAPISKGMIYMEDRAVYEPTRLDSFMSIEIGNSKFLYMELCGPNFDWSDL